MTHIYHSIVRLSGHIYSLSSTLFLLGPGIQLQVRGEILFTALEKVLYIELLFTRHFLQLLNSSLRVGSTSEASDARHTNEFFPFLSNIKGSAALPNAASLTGLINDEFPRAEHREHR